MTTPERAGREGDSQPLPTASDSPYIHDLVAAEIQGLDDPIMLAIAADLEARKTLGIKRYGQPLQAFNGRNPILDAYEEALDLLVYTRQALYEAESTERYSPIHDAYKHALVLVQILKEALSA